MLKGRGITQKLIPVPANSAETEYIKSIQSRNDTPA